MNTEHVLKIQLVLRGPILVKSSNPLSFGLDAALSRVAFGPQAGKVYLPGTLLKGKLAEALTQLGETVGAQSGRLEYFCREWLGNESAEGTDDPYRGRLMFSDLIVLTPEDKTLPDAERRYDGEAVRHRITIDQELGSVRSQHLQVIEMPFAPGRRVAARGECRFFADAAQAAEIQRHVLAGLRWLTQIGADRTTGFGTLLEADAAVGPGRPLEETVFKSKGLAALELSIRPLRPLCIAKPKIGDNLFESEDIVPGNMLKGAVAETWAALAGKRLIEGVEKLADTTRAELGTHFEKIVFRHAFPARQGTTAKRPESIPLCVVKTDGAPTSYWDLAAFDCPVVFPGPEGVAAPAFRTDWKPDDFAAVDPEFGWALPSKELRVRTAIDSVKRRADKGNAATGIEPEGKLFAWEMVHPWQREHDPKDDRQFVDEPVVWRSRVDLSAVPDAEARAASARQLAGLFSQLSFVSKTKAACEVKVVPVYGEPDPLLGETVAVILRTAALLADPRFPEDNGPPESGAIAAERMRELYAAVWWQLSGQSLSLRHYYAAQSLAGGDHLYHRFQKPARPKEVYTPWLLTNPGSVFVFDVKDAVAAKDKLRDWLATGLPLPDRLEARFTGDWRYNPYLPANGFGEIALHRPHAITPAPALTQVERLIENNP